VLPNAKRPENAAKRARQAFTRDFGGWRTRKLSAVRRKDVLDLHAEIGATRKYLANRAVRFLSGLFNFAKDAELWHGENPASRIKLFRETPRTRFLHPDEMARFFAALRKEPNPDLTDSVNLALWTGARKSDVFSMRWQDVSLDDNRWTIPDPKSRRPYVVPLTPEAVKILRGRSKLRTSATWVFPSHGKSGHITDLKSRWKAFLERANIKGLRVHDLRRTQGSWQAGAGVPLNVIGKSLGHSSLASTQVYSVLDIDPVRVAMTAANAAMTAASKRKPKLLPEESHG
jgi:integrase